MYLDSKIEFSPIKLALYGGSGRMGLQVQQRIKSDPKWDLKVVCNRHQAILNPLLDCAQTRPLSELASLLDECDILLDFSQASAFPFLLDQLQDKPAFPCVSGVTGLSEELLTRYYF